MGAPMSGQEKQTPCYQERPPLALSSPRQLCPEPEGQLGGQPGLSWTFCVAEGVSGGSGCGAPGQPFPSLGFGLSVQKQEPPRAIGTTPRRGRPHPGVQRQGLQSALGPGREEAEGSVPTLQMGTLPSRERGRGLKALVSQCSPLGEALTSRHPSAACWLLAFRALWAEHEQDRPVSRCLREWLLPRETGTDSREGQVRQEAGLSIPVQGDPFKGCGHCPLPEAGGWGC